MLSAGTRRALAAPSLGTRWPLAGRSRKICGASGQCSRSVRKSLCLCSVCDEFARRLRSVQGALADHLRGVRTVLAVIAGLSAGAHRAFAGHSCAVGGALAGDLRGVHAVLAWRSQGACVCVAFATSSRGAPRALAEDSFACGGFAKSLRSARQVLAVFAGARGALAERVRSVEFSRLARGACLLILGCVCVALATNLYGARRALA